jgi:hypothetical protein
MTAMTFVILLLLVFSSCGKKEEMTAPQNQPPTEPTLDEPSGSPPHGSSNQSITPRLCWKCTDPEGDSIFYDVYFDAVDGSILVNSDQPENYYEPNTLSYSTTYFWKVTAHDKAGNKATSPVWVFTTLSAPGLVVSDTLLDFGEALNQLTFSISNTGDDTLTWNITVDQAWMSVDHTSGTTLDETDTITVAVDRTGMMCGDYPASIIVDAGSQADTITVNIQVTGLPTLSILPSSLNFLSADNVDSLAITNTTPECGTLTWSISSPQSWISVNPAGGSTDGETDYITVSVNRTGLCEGTHGGSVEITTNGGDASVSLTAQVVVTDLTGSFTPSTLCGNAPLNVTFTTSISGGVPPYTVEWQFADGGTGFGLTPTHVYDTAGTYEVLAKVTDKCGNSDWLASQGDISVVTAGYVILGHDISFTSHDYNDADIGGAGYYQASCGISAKTIFTYAACDDRKGESWASSWGILGRQFTTGACGDIDFKMADLIYETHFYGTLSTAGIGRADFDIDVRLYDVTDGSMLVNDSVIAVRRSSGSGSYSGSPTVTMTNIKIESGHTYRAYLFLKIGCSIDNNIWQRDAAGADFEAHLDRLRIVFK